MLTTNRAAAGALLVAAAGGPVVLPAAARAQVACPAAADDAASTVRLAPPLDRVVAGTSGGPAVPLRTALDQLAQRAGVRLSYSRELLPLDRPSCPTTARVPLGIALVRLLRGTGVLPVGVGDDQVVLAPALAPAASAPSAPAVAELEQVVVTGSAAGGPSRRLPYALDVLDGPALGVTSGVSLSTALDGRVPGLWLWAQPPTSVLARFGSVRGASSFGVTTPKLYLDGVEAANPLVVTELPPERIARVEVIRGPQGAALYGADAISGVINVVTRHDDATGGQTPGRLLAARGGVGGAASDFAGRPAVAQDYSVLVRTGTGARTAGLSFSATTLGAYTPGAASRRLTAVGDVRRVTRAGTVVGTLRLADAATRNPSNPLLAGLPGASPTSGTSDSLAALPNQRLQQLTAGVTVTRAGGGRWTHAVTAGVDAYRLAGVTTSATPFLAALDTAQRSAQGGAARGTLRASSTATYDVSPRVRATVLALADYGLLRDATVDGAAISNTAGAGPPGGPPPRSRAMPGDGRGDKGSMLAGDSGRVAYLGSAGIVGQVTVAVDDALFLTAGLRGERNDGFTDASRYAALPSAGVSYVRPAGNTVTVKLRTAYGRGLRPARTATRAAGWRTMRRISAGLEPEAQGGVEAGVDLFVDAGGRAGVGSGRAGAPTFALHATRFDQRADNLLQQVPLPPRRGGPGGATGGYNSAVVPYAVQNVGVIDNRGWEFAGDVRAGPLTVAATLALVDSRVRRVAAGYTGDLRAGDRMLEVPRRTLGVTAAWQRAGWSATLGAARASHWINYDVLRLARERSASAAYDDARFAGSALRTYWLRYPGVTRLSASAAREVRRGFTLVLTGDNLLDRQQGEPDNATLVPGRTVTLGLRARF